MLRKESSPKILVIIPLQHPECEKKFSYMSNNVTQTTFRPELTQAIQQEVEKCPAAQRLRTHPGGGPLTALAFVLIIGRADRFQCGKQIASYLGLVPLEDSSGNRRRLGHITKQGNALLPFLLVEAAQVTTRSLPEWRSHYVHLTMRRAHYRSYSLAPP
jgi:transposase